MVSDEALLFPGSGNLSCLLDPAPSNAEENEWFLTRRYYFRVRKPIVLVRSSAVGSVSEHHYDGDVGAPPRTVTLAPTVVPVVGDL